MELVPLTIDFELLSHAFEKHVRQKAIQAGSNIVYAVDGKLIEEDPKTQIKTVLKSVSYTRECINR